MRAGWVAVAESSVARPIQPGWENLAERPRRAARTAPVALSGRPKEPARAALVARPMRADWARAVVRAPPTEPDWMGPAEPEERPSHLTRAGWLAAPAERRSRPDRPTGYPSPPDRPRRTRRPQRPQRLLRASPKERRSSGRRAPEERPMRPRPRRSGQPLALAHSRDLERFARPTERSDAPQRPVRRMARPMPGPGPGLAQACAPVQSLDRNPDRNPGPARRRVLPYRTPATAGHSRRHGSGRHLARLRALVAGRSAPAGRHNRGRFPVAGAWSCCPVAP